MGAYRNGVSRGAVYIYTTTSGGTSWKLQTKLTAQDGSIGDEFGSSVALDADTLVVGSEDLGNQFRGSVYVFERKAGTASWTQRVKIEAPEGALNDGFGDELAIHGNTIVVSDWAYDNEAGDERIRAAYIFGRSVTGTWTLQAKLHHNAVGLSANDQFGASVAVDDNVVVVGAWGDNAGTGSAYVFVRSSTTSGTWTQQAILRANDGAERDLFGSGVAVDGATIAVGSAWDDDKGSNSGSVYIFERTSTNSWTQEAKLTAIDGTVDDEFGWRVSLRANVLVVGARLANGGGAAYAFVRSSSSGTGGNGGWVQRAKFTNDNGAAGDGFGSFVALEKASGTIVVGAPGDDNGDELDAGSAYVFAVDGA